MARYVTTLCALVIIALASSLTGCARMGVALHDARAIRTSSDPAFTRMQLEATKEDRIAARRQRNRKRAAVGLQAAGDHYKANKPINCTSYSYGSTTRTTCR